MDGRTHGQRENSITTTNKVCGGYKNKQSLGGGGGIKISVFRVTGLKILGRVGTHIFFNYFFSGKNYNFMHFAYRLSKCRKL